MQKDITLQDEPLRLEGVQYVTGEQHRNNTKIIKGWAKAEMTFSFGCVWL